MPRFGFSLVVAAAVLVAVVVLAHSPTPWIRALGLGTLGVLAAALLGTAGYFLWGAFAGPRVTGGIGNWGMAFLALPVGLGGWIAAITLRHAWRFVPGASPHALTFARLTNVVRTLLGRGGERPSRDRSTPRSGRYGSN